MKKLLAVCLTALVCWVCAGYAEETRVGDTVIFGQYEQDGNFDNGSEPIAWLVLDVQGGKALLMSRYALDCLPFHDEKTDAAWNQSALNAWLQADFHAAFTDAEWAAIAPVTLADTAADGNPEWQNTDAEPAETHVFLLSYAQVMQYLPEQEQRKVSGTEYARSRGAKFLGFTTIGIGETDWWLRSPGKESYDACFLDVRGAVGTKCVTEKLGVRPALWMDLSADRNAFPYEQQVQASSLRSRGIMPKPPPCWTRWATMRAARHWRRSTTISRRRRKRQAEITMPRLLSTRNLRVMRTVTRFAAQAAMKRQ